MIWDYPTKKDDDGDPTEWVTSSRNEERADWAEEAVERFREICSGDNDLSAIYDLIGNLGHLYDRIVATHDLSDELMKDHVGTFEDVIGMALHHYNAERGEGDDIEQAFRNDD